MAVFVRLAGRLGGPYVVLPLEGLRPDGRVRRAGQLRAGAHRRRVHRRRRCTTSSSWGSRSSSSCRSGWASRCCSTGGSGAEALLRTIIFVPYVRGRGDRRRHLVPAAPAGVRRGRRPDHVRIGLTPPEQGFLGTPGLALGTVFVVLTWKYLGLAVLLFLAGLQGVPDELYEAAQLDGASWWQVQRRIAIPLLGPTMRTWGFLSMIGSLQLFDMVWILTGGGPANATTTMATYLDQTGHRPAATTGSPAPPR